MKTNFCVPEFFLGANTPIGFFSLFDQLYFPTEGWFCHILKGGPGTGKSTLMKKIAEKSYKKKISHEIIRCSSDPKSLDAIILQKEKRCIVDGTAPHVMDPIFPGVADEIINLGDYWDSKKLSFSKKEIIGLCLENSNFHKTSQKYLSAYGYAYNSTSRIIEESINLEKLNAFCKRLAKKLIKKTSFESPKEKLRFISSVTPDGYVVLENTLNELCKKIIIIDDPYSVVGSRILEFLKTYALSFNHEVIACPSPFAPQDHLEALIVTDSKLGFIVKNHVTPTETFSKLNIEHEKMYTKRFLELKNKNLIHFNSKICKEFLKESINNLYHAREVHDKIESLYTHSMNYSKINKITQKLESFRA